MATFNDVDAGQALSKLSRKRAANAEVAMPADVCLFAWLAAEAARRNANPIQLTARQIFVGFTDDQGHVDKVGMSLNTIHSSLERLQNEGFISIENVKMVQGGGALMEVTIVEHGNVRQRGRAAS